MTEPGVRSMTAADVREVVRVHMSAFPGFFLTFLGPGFLRELYRGIVADPAGVAFVTEHGGAINGFVAGTTDPSGFYSRLLKRRFLQFGIQAAIATLRRPSAAPRLLRALGRSHEAPAATTGRAELMSLAVLPSARRGGEGGKLVESFVTRSRELGSTTVFLTTDAAGNDDVNAFYARRGFALARTFTTREGRLMNEYEKEIGTPEGTSR